jgi:hypothetical protein
MPTGIVSTTGVFVKKICVAKMPPRTYEDISNNDFLECFRIVIKYIISEKSKGSKRN